MNAFIASQSYVFATEQKDNVLRLYCREPLDFRSTSPFMQLISQIDPKPSTFCGAYAQFAIVLLRINGRTYTLMYYYQDTSEDMDTNDD